MKKLAVYLIPICFLTGLWYGLGLGKKLLPKKNKHSLTFLSKRNFLHPKYVSYLEQRLRTKITVTEYPNDANIEFIESSANYDVIHLPSYLLKKDDDNPFTRPHGLSSLAADRVSADFLRIVNNIKRDQVLIPLAWQVNGFWLDSKENLSSDWPKKFKVNWMDSPNEVYEVLSRENIIQASWVEQSRTSLLLKALNDKKKKHTLRQGPHSIPGPTPNHRFVLPPKGGSLWVHYIGIGKNSENVTLARELIKEMLSPLAQQRWLIENQSATTLISSKKPDGNHSKVATKLREFDLSLINISHAGAGQSKYWIDFYSEHLKKRPK